MNIQRFLEEHRECTKRLRANPHPFPPMHFEKLGTFEPFWVALPKKRVKKIKTTTRIKKKRQAIIFEPSIGNHLAYMQFDIKTGHSRIRNPKTRKYIDYWHNGTIRCVNGSWERKADLALRIPEEIAKL